MARLPSGPACSRWPRRGPGSGLGSTGPAPLPPSGPHLPEDSPPGSSCGEGHSLNSGSKQMDSGRARLPGCAPQAPEVKAVARCGSNNLPGPGWEWRPGQRGRSQGGETQEMGRPREDGEGRVALQLGTPGQLSLALSFQKKPQLGRMSWVGAVGSEVSAHPAW